MRSGKINNRLLCEIVPHSKFDNLNATVATARAEVLARENPNENELYLRALGAAYVKESNFFTHIVHEDIDAIIADIRVQLIKVKREMKIVYKRIGGRKGYKKTEAPQGLKIQKGSRNQAACGNDKYF